MVNVLMLVTRKDRIKNIYVDTSKSDLDCKSFIKSLFICQIECWLYIIEG